MPPKKNKGARRRGTTLSLQDFLFGDGMATAENPNQNKTNPSKSSTPANNKTKKPKSTDAEPLMVTSEEARFRDNSTTNDEKPAAMCALGSPCTKIVEESNQLIPINGDIQAPIATNGCSETDDKHVVAASGSSNIEQFTESQEHNPIVARLSELMAQIETEAVTYSDPYQQPTMGNTRPKRQHRGRRSHNKRRRRGGRRVWAVSMQDGFMQGNVPQPRSTLQTQSHLENQPSYFIDENYNIFLRTSETSEPSQRKGTNMSGRRHMQRSHRQQPDIEETVEMENAFDVTTPPPPPSAPWDCQDIASEPASSSESYNILVVPANNCLTESGGFNKVTIQILVTPERIDIPKHINTSLVLYHPETGEIAARIDNDNVSHCSGNRLECEWFNKLGKVQPIRMELWHRPGQVLPQFLVPKSEGNYIAYCRIPGEMYSFQPVPEVPDSVINPNQDYYSKPGTGFYYPQPEQLGPGQQRTVAVQPRFDCTQSAFIFNTIYAESAQDQKPLVDLNSQSVPNPSVPDFVPLSGAQTNAPTINQQPIYTIAKTMPTSIIPTWVSTTIGTLAQSIITEIH